MRRNTDIARQADKVVCFWNGKSKGCMDTVHKANGKPVVVFGPEGRWRLARESIF